MNPAQQPEHLLSSASSSTASSATAKQITPAEPPTWRNLLDTAQHNNPARHNQFAQLATLQGGDEPRPAVRTVVVRGFLDDGRLMISSDMRSEKVQDLKQHPSCELCWYFTESREQFRLHARAHVVSAAEARHDARLEAAMNASWAQRSAAARQSHTWPQPMRKRDADSAFESPEPDQVPDHFAMVLLDVVTVDYLNIAQAMHTRTLFNKLGGQWRGRAVNP